MGRAGDEHVDVHLARYRRKRLCIAQRHGLMPVDDADADRTVLDNQAGRKVGILRDEPPARLQRRASSQSPRTARTSGATPRRYSYVSRSHALPVTGRHQVGARRHRRTQDLLNFAWHQ